MVNGTRSEYSGSALRVLAFESYDTGSHRQVRRLIENHGQFDWRWLSLPGRGWKWRMRTGASELVEQLGRRVDEWGGWRPDVVFATSLVSLGDLVAQLPRSWRDAAVVLYMHENQLVYPVQEAFAPADDRDLQYPVTNLMSMLAADRVLFNSRWNMESFIGGIGGVLGKAPDGSMNQIEDRLRERSTVAWPPVDLPGSPTRGPSRVLHNAPVVVWPHRWEHDKGPEGLLETARAARERMPLKWVLLGEQFRSVPEPLGVFLKEFGDDIIHAGRIEDRDGYLDMLGRCDWVLSTAEHEFFGVAVVEAMWMGCLPWLPDRLSYPELLPAGCSGLSPFEPPEDPGETRRAVRAHLEPCSACRAVEAIEDELAAVVRGID